MVNVSLNIVLHVPTESAPADCEYMVMSTPTDEGYLDMAAPGSRSDGEYQAKIFFVFRRPKICVVNA